MDEAEAAAALAGEIESVRTLMTHVVGRQHAIETVLVRVAREVVRSDGRVLGRIASDFDEPYGRQLRQGSPSRDVAVAAQDHLRVLLAAIRTDGTASPGLGGLSPPPTTGGAF